MTETYEYSKTKSRARLIRERIYLGVSLAVIAVVIGHPGRLHLIVMNRFDAQDCHSERIVPGGELSFFGEAELTEGGCCRL